jgi:glucokinase
MYLGIEIGGTKLQLGVGRGDGGPLVAVQRLVADAKGGAEAIRRQLAEAGNRLIAAHNVRAIGIGFGGPVDPTAGRTVESHQVHGWEDYPIVDWAQSVFNRPTVLANDSDSAGLAEALFGAGKGRRLVVYSNVGSGIGGALVFDGRLHTGSGGVAAEIGQMRPGPDAALPEQSLEAIASGWAITDAVRRRLTGADAGSPDARDLFARCHGALETLDTRRIADAALAGNAIARAALDRACRAYGWALAQVVTLLAPEVIVLGGGVSLVERSLFLEPVRRYVAQYVFPPLAGRYAIVPAELGEEVVVHGALALALALALAAALDADGTAARTSP